MPDHQGYGEISRTLGEIPIHKANILLYCLVYIHPRKPDGCRHSGNPVKHQLLIFLTGQCGFIKSPLLLVKNDSIVTYKSACML